MKQRTARRRSKSHSSAVPGAAHPSRAVLVEDRKRRFMPPPTRGILEGVRTWLEKSVDGDHFFSSRGRSRVKPARRLPSSLPDTRGWCPAASCDESMLIAVTLPLRPTSLPTGEISGSLPIDRFRFEGIPPSTSPASAEPPQGNPAPAAFSPGEAISSPSDQGAMFRLFHPDFAGPTPGPSNPIPRSFWEPLSRSWSHFVGLYRQKLSKSSKIDF